MAGGALHTYRRPLAAVLAAVCALALLAGCGEARYDYISNVDEQTYFKLPKGYTQVTEGVGQLDEIYLGTNPESFKALLLRESRWSRVFDASAVPSANHLVTARRTPQPVIYAVVQHLLPEMRDKVSYDYMRDYLWPPVTLASRLAYQERWQQAIATGLVRQGPAPWSGYELLHEQMLTPSEGFRGLRVRYNYEVEDLSVNTFDLTIYTNNDSTVLYALMIRCDFRCYRARIAEFDEIATSFTVRSKA
jgi:hypothetical protein